MLVKFSANSCVSIVGEGEDEDDVCIVGGIGTVSL